MVTVATDPVNPAQTCTVANAAGVVNNANVTNVAVDVYDADASRSAAWSTVCRVLASCCA